MSNSFETLPLLYNGDSFIIELSPVGQNSVKVESITRFPDNQNTDGVHEQFRDLDPETKRAVITQINRRHHNKVVRV